jgi:hypothetical protein
MGINKMKTIDELFILYIICLIIYVQTKPGTQMIPPVWNIEERMNWKPTHFFWINFAIIISYILFKQIKH